MGEFEAPAQIALINSTGRGSLRTSPLRQFVEETFPERFSANTPSSRIWQPVWSAQHQPGGIGVAGTKA